MPRLDRGEGALWYDVVDVTAPWGGAAETIVFHHGLGIHSDIWLPWFPVLADRYRLARFDMRGFGRSEPPRPGVRWSMEGLAADVLAIAEAAGASEIHLVGEATGGIVAMYMAAQHARAIRSITLLAAPHRGGSMDGVRGWRTFIEQHGMQAWSQSLMTSRFDPDATPDSLYRWYEGEQAKSPAGTMLEVANLVVSTDLTDVLPGIEPPALLLAPDSSPFVPLALAREIHRLIPGSELQAFAGARHGIAASHGRDCALALREFLKRRMT